jgi:putative DNA-invertase from lambdoid prophage Rac
MRAFLYARVSTTDKEQNPEVQLRELREFCQRRGWATAEFMDKMSGTKSQRPQFQDMLRQVRQKKCDVVLVYRLNRFARSTRELVTWLDEFHALGIEFVSLHESIDTSTPQGRLLFRLIAAIAEFEVDMIRENVRAGIAYARSQGRQLGRPRRIADSLKITTMRGAGIRWGAIAEASGVSVSTAKRIARSAAQGQSKTGQKPVPN